MRPMLSCTLVLMGAWALSGCRQPTAPPQAFREYTAPRGAFKCEYPADWHAEAEGGDRTAATLVRFRRGEAEIRIDEDPAPPPLPEAGRRDGEGESPLVRFHDIKTQQLDQEFKNYIERETPRPFSSRGFGEGCRAMFVADGSSVGRYLGYHLTLADGDRRFTILCRGPATDWKALRPTFDRVIESFARSK